MTDEHSYDLPEKGKRKNDELTQHRPRFKRSYLLPLSIIFACGLTMAWTWLASPAEGVIVYPLWSLLNCIRGLTALYAVGAVLGCLGMIISSDFPDDWTYHRRVYIKWKRVFGWLLVTILMTPFACTLCFVMMGSHDQQLATGRVNNRFYVLARFSLDYFGEYYLTRLYDCDFSGVWCTEIPGDYYLRDPRIGVELIPGSSPDFIRIVQWYPNRDLGLFHDIEVRVIPP